MARRRFEAVSHASERGQAPLAFAFLALLALSTLASVACGGSNEPDDGRTTLELTNHDGGRARLRVEIADTDAERTKGLSNRAELGADQGMLFVIEQRGPGFWMKDTTIPLSVAFIGTCGEIVAVADMQPLTLEIHGTPFDYRFGLEVNLGWFTQHKIGVGDSVRLPESVRPPACPS